MSDTTGITILPMDDTEFARCRLPDGLTPGALETPRGHLPLASLDVRASIVGLDARVTLEQAFVNAFDVPLEATYIFPLPDRLGVHAFRLVVADRIIVGELKERGEARRTYDRAIADGHRAAIAEQERPDVFTVRAGNIAPRERVTVSLELAGPLAMVDGEAVFRFPLVVPPRYIPGVPLDGASVGTGTQSDTDAVPDASRITPPVRLPGMNSPVRLGLAVSIDAAGLPIEGFRSSLHAIHVTGRDELGRVQLGLASGTECLDRDFILRFGMTGDGIRTSMTVHRDAGDAETGEGTFALTIVGPTAQRAGIRPRDVVVVLDRSGSMAGWKIAAARRAAARIVDSLTDRDRLGVILFHSLYNSWQFDGGAGLVAASDRARFRAVEFLAGASADGGTEMAAPLLAAAGLLARSASEGRDGVMVLVTDGQVGNEDQLLASLHDRVKGVRIHTIGIDREVNASFLRRLAESTGGCVELAESEEQLDRVMAAIHRRIGGPVLTGVTVRGEGWTFLADQSTPQGPVDVFPGSPSRIFGRFRGAPGRTLTIEGTPAWAERFEAALSPSLTHDSLVRTAWARQRVLDMEYAYAACGKHDREMVRRIVAHSLKYGVLCRFTAFVAVDGSQVVNPGGQGHRVTQPVDSASGWEMLKSAPAAAFEAGMHIGIVAGVPTMSMRRAAAPGLATVSGAFDCLEAMAGPEEAPSPGSAAGGGRIARAAGKLASAAVKAIDSMKGSHPSRGGSAPGRARTPPGTPPGTSPVNRRAAPPAPPSGAGNPQEELRRLFGDALRALIARHLAALKAATNAAQTAREVDLLRTELRALIVAMRAAIGSCDRLLADLERCLAQMEALDASRCVRGDLELGILCQHLVAIIAVLLGEAAAGPGPRATPPRSEDFWM